MTQTWLIPVAIGAISAATLLAGDEGREKLIGRWTSQTPAQGWSFEQNQDALKVVFSQGSTPVAEFQCNTMGKECKFKDGGKNATVSMWFSGPKLVELETRGSEVVKRRFQVSDDGDKLEVEIIPVVPAGKPETLHLQRVRAEANAGTAHP